MATETNFRSSKFQMSENAVLSQSTWEYGESLRFSIAVIRKIDGVWDIDYSSVIDGAVYPRSNAKRAEALAETERGYKLVDLSAPILEAEMEEVPVRFYRDNVLDHFRW